MVDPKSIVPGQVLAGKYRVEHVLGVGGMGVVVAATHMHLGQRVALKLMLPEMLARPALAERFGREARAAASLRSAHAAHVFDVGVLDTGIPYMVMEFLEGSDLASILLARGSLPVDVAVDCVLQACDAVAEAHSLGIVHRDLKPGNLFLTQRNDGRALVKVLDFGISKQTTTPAELSITRTTEVIGSPNYMSPEQFRAARGVDARSDIWSLGVILHELLSGGVPFVAENFNELVLKVLQEPPLPLSTLTPGATPDLARIVNRCLEKDPAHRFASVAELAAALAPFAPADSRELAVRIARISNPGGQPPGGRGVSSTPSTSGPPTHAVASGTAVTVGARTNPSRRGRKAWVAGGALLLAGVAGAGVAIARRSRPHHVDEAPIASQSPSVETDAVPRPLPSSVASAPAPASALASAPAPASAPEPASAPAPERASASASVSAPAHAATAHAHAHTAPVAPPSLASSSTSLPAEPPSHRTSW
jgi:serine/threonine protein kinase